MKEKVLQLKVSLTESKPKIWRMFLVKGNTNFHKLHLIIQEIMGWENYHLHIFSINGVEIGEPDPDYERKIIDSRKTKINKFLNSEKKKLRYEYDFGDGWQHEIIVEKVLDKDTSKKYPICIAGEMACPPEDCGGIYGYYEMLRILKNKKHPEYKRWHEWVGNFNPEKFDLGKINKRLQKS